MRKGFGLITAIIVLVLVSTLMTLMISLSSRSAKQTTDVYFKEQAELLSRSGVEYGLLALSGHDNSLSCVEDINITYQNLYDIDLSFYYLYSGGLTPVCNHVLANNVVTKESNMTTVIDVRVSVRQAVAGLSEPIVIHRRTIQKP